MKRKGILFDLDETLLDRRSSLKSFVRQQAEKLDLSGQAGQFVARFLELDANGSVWKDQVYQILTEEFSITSVSVDGLLQDYLAHFRHYCEPRLGALTAIQALSVSGIPMGLVSNGYSPFQEDNFSALGVADKFRVIIVSGAVGIRKPDPRIFYLACEQLHTNPSETIFVGDNPVADIHGAKSAGLKTIYIPGFYGDACPDADTVCHQLEKLPEIAEMLWKTG